MQRNEYQRVRGLDITIDLVGIELGVAYTGKAAEGLGGSHQGLGGDTHDSAHTWLILDPEDCIKFTNIYIMIYNLKYKPI